MSAPEALTVPSRSADAPAWHAMSACRACAEPGVDATMGLDPAEAERRRGRYGANKELGKFADRRFGERSGDVGAGRSRVA